VREAESNRGVEREVGVGSRCSLQSSLGLGIEQASMVGVGHPTQQWRRVAD
jgi:hypothetical protein